MICAAIPGALGDRISQVLASLSVPDSVDGLSILTLGNLLVWGTTALLSFVLIEQAKFRCGCGAIAAGVLLR